MTSGSSPDNRALWTKIASIVLLVGCCVAIGFLIRSWIGLANLAFIFLIPVVAVSGRLGTGAGLASAGVATLAFNFFFVPPTWTFHVASVDNIVTLTMFAGTAIVVSQFAARLKAQAVRAERLAKDSALLAQLSADLSGAKDQSTLAQLLVIRLATWSGAQIQLIKPSVLESVEQNLGPMDRSAAMWTISHGVAAGRGSDVLPGADSLYLPMDVGEDKSWILQFWRGDT
jgi:two-component system sensor histidine kinase KdpD